jgi:hypothetical protein
MLETVANHNKQQLPYKEEECYNWRNLEAVFSSSQLGSFKKLGHLLI